MNVILDIAATVSAIVWPVALLMIFLAYRKEIPGLATSLARRVSKVQFGGLSLELAVAKPFVPEWSGGDFDLRHRATSVQVNDSTAGTFADQLTVEGAADYAEVNLGRGAEWLTSRLFFMAIVFARVKGIKSFVFMETVGDVRKQYLGWTTPEAIRWSLAMRYPWLEHAYADAYSMITQPNQGWPQGAVIVSRQGRLGYQHNPTSAEGSVELLKQFLERIQAPPSPHPIPEDIEEWVVVDPGTNTHEHARWLNGELLEELLDDRLHTTTYRENELRSQTTQQRVRSLLAGREWFTAVVSDDQRFRYLIDRHVLLEQVAKRLSSEDSGLRWAA